MRRDVRLGGLVNFSGEKRLSIQTPAPGAVIQNSLLELELTIFFYAGAWLNNYTSQPLCKPV